MIRIKSIVEIINECDRKDMNKKFQEMPLNGLRDHCSSALEEELKTCLGDDWKVHVKDVEVTENE